MTTSRTPLLRKKWPLLALVLAAILALILVIWQLQTSPETNDAYVYADTIDVVPEVSGRIVEMPIRDNQRVKKGDLLFRIDPRPYQAMLDDAKARLTTLDAQIMLTQRTIKAQEYNAQSVAAASSAPERWSSRPPPRAPALSRWCRRGLPPRKISIRRAPLRKRRGRSWRPRCCRPDRPRRP